MRRMPSAALQQYTRILESLAMARAVGRRTLGGPDFATNRGASGAIRLLSAITPSTDESWVGRWAMLQRRGAKPAAIVLEPNTFG